MCKVIPEVTIIVPVYNTEKYLSRCIRSILAQTLINIEVILVNDDSTDSSLSICTEYAKQDSRIKVISQKHSGVSAARNLGISQATGIYIGFTDSDDYIAPQMYETLYLNAIKNDCELAGCRRQKVFETGEREISTIAPIEEGVLSTTEQFFETDLHLVSLIVKASLIKNNRIFFDIDLRCGEDIIFLVTIYQIIKHMYYIPLYLTYWYQHINSITHAKGVCLENLTHIVTYHKSILLDPHPARNKERERKITTILLRMYTDLAKQKEYPNISSDKNFDAFFSKYFSAYDKILYSKNPYSFLRKQLLSKMFKKGGGVFDLKLEAGKKIKYLLIIFTPPKFIQIIQNLKDKI